MTRNFWTCTRPSIARKGKWAGTKHCKFQKLPFLIKINYSLLLQHMVWPGYVKESHHQNDCILMTRKAAHDMSLLQAARSKPFKTVSCIFCGTHGYAGSIKCSSNSSCVLPDPLTREEKHNRKVYSTSTPQKVQFHSTKVIFLALKAALY